MIESLGVLVSAAFRNTDTVSPEVTGKFIDNIGNR